MELNQSSKSTYRPIGIGPLLLAELVKSFDSTTGTVALKLSCRSTITVKANELFLSFQTAA